jgi:outer membrane beta-barrel protein
MNQESSTTAHRFRGPALRGVRVVLSCAALWFAWVAPARAQGESPADSAAVSAPATASSPAPADTAATSEADAPNARMLVSNKRVELVGNPENVVRSGPGNGYAIVATYPRGRTFTVIALHEGWYGIRLSDTETGWVNAALCKELDDLGGLEFKPNPKLYSRTGTFVMGGYAGGYVFDRKSNSLSLGGRFGYYLFDRWQAEVGVSWSHIQRSQEIVESLFGLSLEAEDFHMLFYQMNLVWEVLPGRQMVPYVTAGAGATVMLGRSEPGVNFGAGTTLFFSRRSAMRWEVKDYRFSSGPDKARVDNNNIEFTLGTEYLF